MRKSLLVARKEFFIALKHILGADDQKLQCLLIFHCAFEIYCIILIHLAIISTLRMHQHWKGSIILTFKK